MYIDTDTQRALERFCKRMKDAGIAPERYAVRDLTLNVINSSATRMHYDNYEESCTAWRLLATDRNVESHEESHSTPLTQSEYFAVNIAGKLYIINADKTARRATPDDIIRLNMCLDAMRKDDEARVDVIDRLG
jgi:hypothetical protein